MTKHTAVSTANTPTEDRPVAKTVQEFFAKYPEHTYSAGEVVIFPDGNTVTHVCYIVRGKLCQYDISAAGTKAMLNIFHNPAFVPVVNAVSGQPNRYFYEALTDVSVRQAPAKDVVALIQKNPEVMFDMLSRLASGIEGVLGKMAHLMAGTARTRLLFELAITAERFGAVGPDNKNSAYITESQLASQTGLARETISRELQKLKAEGLVSLSKGKITIDVENLHAHL